MAKDIIPIQDFNQGGLAKSRWSGIQNTLHKMIGFDPHTKPGVLDVEQKLTKISGSTVTELCKYAVTSSNGSVYFFSFESGKVWEKPASGDIRLVHTTSASLGANSCLGAAEHESYIYWATQKKLHRIAVSKAGDNNWSADAVQNWAEFQVGDSDYHPMYSHSPTLTLFIGDGKQLAQVESNVFSANALDIRPPLRVKCLGQIGTDVLIGTFVTDNFNQTEIIRWNTWDDSFTSSDPIPEVGINAFLKADNVVLVQAGKKGNIYWYDGTNLELFMTVPGEFSPSAKGEVYPGSVSNIDGHILFGWTNTEGNPTESLVYRIGRHDRDFPYIMDQPYPISERDGSEFVVEDIEIGALTVAGSYIYVCWKNGSTCGIDRLDLNNKLSGAYFDSRVMIVEREEFANFSECMVAVSKRDLGGDMLPTGTDIDFYTSRNYQEYKQIDTEIDTDRNMIKSNDSGTDFTTMQLRVKVTTSGNNAPLIESAGVRIR
jgi:hypothetical protein